MADFKQHRINENKVHEQLFGNLFLLSQLYPTSSEFKAVFKKDMFVKNNKAAFFEVVYYLLCILNPELTKEKLISWPPYDIKRENKFRTEVLKYISELNTLYDNADIPHIMASHLISPGGLKFTEFMLKLSQLVIYEHLKRTDEDDVLCHPVPSKNTVISQVNLNSIKKKTSSIEREIKNVTDDFQSFHINSNEKALSIDNELKRLNDEIREAKKTNVLMMEEFNKNYPDYPSPAALEEKMRSLKSRYERIYEFQKLLKECESLMTYLNSNKVVLEHVKEELRVPDEILNVVGNREELNLTDFFRGLNILLEKKALEFPYPTDLFVQQSSEKVNELIGQYSEVSDHLKESTAELQRTLEKMSKIKLLVETVIENEEEETLAVPLDDSSKPN